MKLLGNDVRYLTFNIFKDVLAVHSTRQGGVSKGHFASMNLGFSRGDLRENVFSNYELFASALEVDAHKMVLSHQCHHNNILDVTNEHLGMGIYKDRSFEDVDGLITSIKNLPLVTFYADCVPIYFYDPVEEVIGMCHAGWRGTATMIVKDMIDKMHHQYRCKLKDILIGIGPAICYSCYQVDQEVISAMPTGLEDYYRYEKAEKKYYIDLKGINKQHLLDVGIDKDHIEVTDLCTKCRPDLFFSHRRHGNNRGTQVGLMMMKG